jgi:HPt (histidine-containing phosphotransfer) domain-containing protein
MDNLRFEIAPTAKRRFLERRKQDLAECRKAPLKFAWKMIESVGHRLRGSSATYGYPELGKLGEKLERGAQKQDHVLVDQELKAFEEWVARHSYLPIESFAIDI